MKSVQNLFRGQVQCSPLLTLYGKVPPAEHDGLLDAPQETTDFEFNYGRCRSLSRHVGRSVPGYWKAQSGLECCPKFATQRSTIYGLGCSLCGVMGHFRHWRNVPTDHRSRQLHADD